MSDGGTEVAWIALGSNVGNRRDSLHSLRRELSSGGLVIAGASPEIITRAVGVTTQRDFLNQVVRVEAARPMNAVEWMSRCKAAEGAAGRGETYRWGPRRADADILLLGPDGAVRYLDDIVEVPHPRLGERAFFCALLASLDPTLKHPDGWTFASRSRGATSKSADDPRAAARS